MKKRLLIGLLGLFAIGIAYAGYPAGYYNKMDGKSKADLKAAAKECVQNHQRLVYSQLPLNWQYTDVYEDLYDGCRRWWDMYSNNIFLIRQYQDPLSSFSANRMQREHAVPKSWWKKNGDVEYTPAYSDLWNLYPSDGPANQAKLNYPLGEVKNANYDNGVTRVGTPVTGQGGGSGYVFEPGDEYKGDFARAFFYMATVYDDLPWVINYMYDSNSYPTLRSWAVNTLLQWARQDPVSQKEMMRNDAVQIQQGNRNPFIDFPELAEFIWGTRTSEVFYVAEQGGNVTPPITGDPELTSPVDGEALDFGEVAVTQTVSAPLHIDGKNLTGPLTLRVTGSDKAMFKLTANSVSASDINQGFGFLLNIIYAPTAEGRHEAALTLYDGGLPVTQNVNVKLIGQAYPIPTLSTLTAYDATNISDNSYTANWGASSDVVDYYIVHRVRYYEDGPESDELMSDTNSLEITDRDPNITETYYVQSSRLGYTSEPSNVITVAAGSNVVGVGASQPLAIGTISGGVVILTDMPQKDVKVYDVAGSLMRYLPEAEGDTQILLPQGIYVITSSSAPKPIKIVVN